jgi:hypothetical protein
MSNKNANAITLRMTVTEDRLENDPPGTPRRKTVGLSLATESDRHDDNGTVKATSVQLMIHGCEKPGWLPFVEGGDFLVTITAAEPILREKSSGEGGAGESKPSKS